MKKHYRSDKSCLNCGTTVPDKFCPNCGQENLELHEDFLHVAVHSVGHYFHFESKFFNSIVPLFTKPGYLTKEYFAGKRASHLNPISMYIFISILFFFLFTANSNMGKKDIIEEKAAAEAVKNTEATKQDISKLRKAVEKKALTGKVSDKAATYTYTILDNAEAALDTGTNDHNDAIIFTNPVGKKGALVEKYDPEQQELVLTSAEENAVLHSLEVKAREVADDEIKGQLFINKLVSHLPKIMFILLPLFALILKLVNYRSKTKYYVEHLIYSIHVHSFLFLFISLLILISWILPATADWLQFIGVVVSLWYIYRSMRNIYQSSRWRTIYKFFVLFLSYGVLLMLSGLIVVVATLYTV